MTDLTTIQNNPSIWLSQFPRPKVDGHKYHRGHTVIFGSQLYTGATRLAAAASSRIGCGLVTVLSDDMADVYRATLPADIMIKSGDVSQINRVTTLLAGPGGCTDEQATSLLRTEPTLSIVLDADAIRLAHTIAHKKLIVTPHEAEFERYFGPIQTSRPSIVIEASKQANAVIVLKGAETLITSPDGRIVCNTEASPYLAKAGTGDVLAGMIAGLLAQGMPPFEASCTAVWMHGHAGKRIGPGLIPQDITQQLPAIMHELVAG